MRVAISVLGAQGRLRKEKHLIEVSDGGRIHQAKRGNKAFEETETAGKVQSDVKQQGEFGELPRNQHKVRGGCQMTQAMLESQILKDDKQGRGCLCQTKGKKVEKRRHF